MGSTVLLIGKTAMGVAKPAAFQTAEAAQLNTFYTQESGENPGCFNPDPDGWGQI
jgi:hypothetical protein